LPGQRDAIAELARALELPLTRIGRMVAGKAVVRLLDADGRERNLTTRGFDHFAQDPH
jgi:hypothetical protein